MADTPGRSKQRVPVAALLFVASPLLAIAAVSACTAGMYIVADFRTISASEFRKLANQSLPPGSSERDVLAFMQTIEDEPPQQATVFADPVAQPAASFNKGPNCRFNGDCLLAHIDQSAPVLFLRLDNTRGGVFPCDGGGVFVYFVLDRDGHLLETITEGFHTCL
jgi:hypothetical protein